MWASQNDAAEAVLLLYGNMLYRIALGMTASREDAEDAVQETMLRYLRRHPPFRESEHEKAWMIRVTMNVCRDILRRRTVRRYISLDAIAELPADDPCSDVLSALAALPTVSRQVLLLHYVEGYSVRETAALLGIGESAAKMRLQKGRERLKNAYEEELL